MYAHVQIVRRITISKLWKLKIADCTRAGGAWGARQRRDTRGALARSGCSSNHGVRRVVSRAVQGGSCTAHPQAVTCLGARGRWALGFWNYAWAARQRWGASQRIGSTIPCCACMKGSLAPHGTERSAEQLMRPSRHELGRERKPGAHRPRNYPPQRGNPVWFSGNVAFCRIASRVSPPLGVRREGDG